MTNLGTAQEVIDEQLEHEMFMNDPMVQGTGGDGDGMGFMLLLLLGMILFGLITHYV